MKLIVSNERKTAPTRRSCLVKGPLLPPMCSVNVDSADQCPALRIDSTDTPDAAALDAAAPRLEWPEKRSVSTPAAFSSFLIQAEIVELCTWGCWPTEPMNKRSLFLSVRYFSVTSQYRLRHLPGAPPLWAFLNLESEKETPSAVKLIDLLSIPASSLALSRVARDRRVASFEANAPTESEAFSCPLR
ncbi:hypothetical protein OUZ56_012444 [Daphnia magna]|uniref:Uncharacterized protein n=1 Tax=Daphnia magna TaxID=35525 RepID=A0ABQ9Z363_9CRUS|nr:hypothetical protein OUZ56_012444 [Daphnia magna]